MFIIENLIINNKTLCFINIIYITTFFFFLCLVKYYILIIYLKKFFFKQHPFFLNSNSILFDFI